MFALRLLPFFTVLGSVCLTTAVSNGNCFDTVLPISITANNIELKLSAPRNQQELTDIWTRATSLTSNVTAEIIGGPVTNKATYKIWTQLCVPSKPDAAKTVANVVLNVELASTIPIGTLADLGRSTTTLRRLSRQGMPSSSMTGSGLGSQTSQMVSRNSNSRRKLEIASELVKYLRAKPRGNQFNRVVGIGHSYGSTEKGSAQLSVTLLSLVGKYGNVLDAAILTGFTAGGGLGLTAFAAVGWTIAAQQNPKRFGSLPTSYMTTEGISNSQSFFFRYGNYETAVLQAAEATKATATLGELFTGAANPALNYTNPVFMVTGDKDYPFCGGNCYQKINGTNLVDASKVVFPAVPESKFSTFIPAETGHGNNLHLSAPEAYGKIQDWIAQL
ncbi:hypothetical protein DFP72DRAFT_858203 [Ephemerocybe angulata]|uniref:Uncharacterized protein n=1 Tax=Ephemerocybe angulata TaxID=980116 RepID=A0A8H6LWN8_9AGAR|nr:hypothetical protein DFP72DRAFT_858203 [Tulosesus angulatus]